MSDHPTVADPFDICATGEELFGPLWHAPLARLLNVNPRTVQRWASGQNDIPEAMTRSIADLLALVRRIRTDAAEQRAAYRGQATG
jgi:hypothetical protein